ncbi:MAG: carbon-nitrogen hydrolase family protein [Comamonas sp.]
MKVAVLQMVSTPDVQDNLRVAEQLVAQASTEGAELVVLPEYFCGMGLRDTDKLAWAEAAAGGPIQAALSRWAANHQIWLAAGTVPLQSSHPGKVFNSCLLFGPQGQLHARYDKIHLFRYSNELEHYDEAAVIAAGQQPIVATIEDRQGRSWRLGLSVCYDLRFPELYRAHVQAGADMLLVPSAFTHTTGQAHWEILLRARAIENQCWVLAAAQGGKHPNGRLTWGHSMVVDPWGEILTEQEQDGPGIGYAVLDLALLQQVRTRLPALEHRCL